MARGATARNRRSERRAAERETQGVRKAPDPTLVAATNPSQDDPPSEPGEREMLSSISGRLRGGIVLDQLVAAGVPLESGVAVGYDLAYGDVAEATFVSAVVAAGYGEERFASWPCGSELGDHGEVLYRSAEDGVFRIGDVVVYARISHGWAQVRVASGDRAAISETVASFQAAYPALFREESAETVVPVTFWTYREGHGPSSRLRMIEAASWDEIAGNYPSGVADELARTMRSFEPGRDGQLLLWQGPPGTGKTWALRALASEWRDWAEVHYITDPDAFFVKSPPYMIDVLLADTYDETVLIDDEAKVATAEKGGRWRVLIFEDTGELLSARAKEEYGQGLSRLLNVVDGMVGQGLRVLALITTNDELGDLHPAAVRPGRCASQVTFGPLSPEEADAWIMRADHEGPKIGNRAEPATLAELYAEVSGAETAFAVMPDAECSCGHLAEDHAGDNMDGPCSATMADGEACPCEAFELAETETEADADPGEATVVLDPGLAAAGAYGDDLELLVLRSALAASVSDETAAPLAERLRALAAEVEEVQIAPPAETRSGLAWRAIFAPEGRPTDDFRIFAPGSISWREPPLTLMAQLETQEGHDGAVVGGKIERIWKEAGFVLAEGEFVDSDQGREIARLVDEEVLTGVSVDIAILAYEVAPRADVLDADGNWIGDDRPAAGDSVEDVIFDMADPMLVVTDGKIGAATVCPFPAFEEARISLLAGGAGLRMTLRGVFVVDGLPPREEREPVAPGYGVNPFQQFRNDTNARVATPESVNRYQIFGSPETGATSLSAAAAVETHAGVAPERPPVEWFLNPELSELTALTIEDDGRVYGHVAPHGVCHTGIPDVCTTVPLSMTDYAFFHLADFIADHDGPVHVPVGKLTLGTDHAGRDLGWRAAVEHYENTGTVAAYLRAGQDEFGIWVAGSLAHSFPASRLQELRGSTPSGDWRGINDNLEMIGLLAVNVPGFPVPRPEWRVVRGPDGKPVVASLTAAAAAFESEDGIDIYVDSAYTGLTAVDLSRIRALHAAAGGGIAALARLADGEEG